MGKQITLEQYKAMGHEAAVEAFLGKAVAMDYDLDSNSDNMRGIQCEMIDGMDYADDVTFWQQMAADEIADGFWQDSVNELTAVESNGLFNVDGLAHWSAVTPKSEGQTIGEFRQVARRNSAAAAGARSDFMRKLDAEAYAKHVTRQANKRAHFGLPEKKEEPKKRDRVAERIRKEAKAQQRAVTAAEKKAKFAAMLEANKAKWNK